MEEWWKNVRYLSPSTSPLPPPRLPQHLPTPPPTPSISTDIYNTLLNQYPYLIHRPYGTVQITLLTRDGIDVMVTVDCENGSITDTSPYRADIVSIEDLMP